MKEIIRIGDKHLVVTIEKPQHANQGYALSLHGGGLSTKETIDYLRPDFTDRGFGMISFDFSGWGESSGRRDECSLSGRLDDALALIRHYELQLDFLIGTSMGGHVALKLLEHVDVPNLILFCPAAYAVSAWQLPFGHGFTEDIRRKNSFLETDVTAICAAYRGNVLYVIGDRDDVIPDAVSRNYQMSFVQARRFREVRLNDCPHPIHRWAADKPDTIATIHAAISSFISSAMDGTPIAANP